jgi:hypothetical protein
MLSVRKHLKACCMLFVLLLRNYAFRIASSNLSLTDKIYACACIELASRDFIVPLDNT